MGEPSQKILWVSQRNVLLAEEVGGEEKEESPQRAHQPRNSGRSDLIINKAEKEKRRQAKA